jgi:hypothetical protein
MADVIMLKDLGVSLKVNLPDFRGNLEEYEATWMRCILDEVFEMAFGVTIWLVHIHESIITPLSCVMYFTEDECRSLDLGKSLGLYYNEGYSGLVESILLRRANKYYAEHE